MKKNISVLVFVMLAFCSCMKQEAETNNEPLPFFSCQDSIQNQDEEGIDCGGPCAPCKSTMKALVDGVQFTAVSGNTDGQVQNNVLYFNGSDASGASISFYHTQDFLPGTYNNAQALYINSFGQYTTQQATLTFTEFDLTDNIVEGTFNFTAINFSNQDTVVVTNGEFSNVSF